MDIYAKIMITALAFWGISITLDIIKIIIKIKYGV